MALPTISVTPGSGATINTLPNAPATTVNSVSVALATDQATLPISVVALPLPSGASQDGVDGSGIAPPAGGLGIRGWLSGIYSKLSGTISVSGTFWQATQPISAASLPLPTGAATASGVGAVVTALGSPLQAGGSVGLSGALPSFAATPTFNIGTLNGAATSTLQTTANASLAALVTATGASSMQQTGGTVGLVAGSAIIGKMGIDQTTPGTTNGVTVIGGAVSLTDRSGRIYGAVGSATPQVAGGGASHSYAPGDMLTMPGGAGVVTPAVLAIAATGVVSATIAAGGTGGTNGTQTVTGTTGAGTKFTASVTVAGGVITAILSLLTAGFYTINPLVLTAEPVTGGGLSGAQLSLNMGIISVTVSTAGSYSVQPPNPVTPASTSGMGTGATVNLSGWTPLSTPLVSSNMSRQYLAVLNEHLTASLGFTFGATAAIGTIGTTAFSAAGGGYAWEGSRVPSNAAAVIGQVAFQQYTAWEG